MSAAWVLLGLAIASEVIGTTALRASNDHEGVLRILLVGSVAVGYAVSFWLLALVLRKIELGVAYAVWAGVGTAITAMIGVALFNEGVSAIKIACIALIVLGVVGLEVSGSGR